MSLILKSLSIQVVEVGAIIENGNIDIFLYISRTILNALMSPTSDSTKMGVSAGIETSCKLKMTEA